MGGDRILPAVRVMTLAHELLMHHRAGGWTAAAEVARAIDPVLDPARA